MICLVFLACLSVALGGPDWNRNLIVGGVKVPKGSRPYQVALFESSSGGYNSQYCGGTLVHENWVVSAAHCAIRKVYVGLGYHRLDESGKQIIKGTWTAHPSFNFGDQDNDVALIRLSTPATLSSTVQTIGIASANSDVSAGTSLLVSGWGATSSGGAYPMALRQVIVRAVSRSDCKKKYSGRITDNMVCAAASGKDACQHDSGGPIVSGYNKDSHNPATTLSGIVSWGYGCADPKYPGVYTRVANYCSWINTNTGGDVSC